MGLDDVGGIIIDLIREGRRLLTNTYQACGFADSNSKFSFSSDVEM